MGDLEIPGGDGFVIVEEDVEIDQTRTFGKGFLATHLRFDVTQRVEEFGGGEIRLRFEDGVEEPGLVQKINGLGFVKAGKFPDVDAALAEESNGSAQVFLAVADVGTQRQINSRHVQ